MRQRERGTLTVLMSTPQLPAQSGHLNRSYLDYAEQDNPDRVRYGAIQTGNPTARKGQFSSGNGKWQEAKAGSRKATGIHNRPDRAIPNSKEC
ncbi:hypothetical protein NKDENANG_04082 [Candidatus Entotheonellaceae bacterium PAL068K]